MEVLAVLLQRGDLPFHRLRPSLDGLTTPDAASQDESAMNATVPSADGIRVATAFLGVSG
jgi:hypothetical protein